MHSPHILTATSTYLLCAARRPRPVQITGSCEHFRVGVFFIVLLNVTTTSTMVNSEGRGATPHTHSSTRARTGLKAALGASTFFHSHLQEGLRIEETRSDASSTLRHISSGLSSDTEMRTHSSTLSNSLTALNSCEEPPRVSQRHELESSAPVADIIPSTSQHHLQMPPPIAPLKTKTRSASAMTPTAGDRKFWEMVADAQASQNAPSSGSRQYHYMTRSQSADAASAAPAPRLRKQASTFNPPFETPLIGTAMPWQSARGRALSPIEEVQFSLEKQGDTASLNSNASVRSNLFINRSVRRTGSTSTLNSGQSSISHSPEDLSTPLRVHARPYPALPVIPASPRESQNVFEAEPIPFQDSSITFPPYTEMQFGYPVEQDISEDLSTPRFANPRHLSEAYTERGQDIGDASSSRTPSLLARSESVRTELTYLTAQDSAIGSRRASAVQGDLEAGETTLVDHDKKSSPIARLKASFETLLPKVRRVPGQNSPVAIAASVHSISQASTKWLSQAHSNLKERASAPLRASTEQGDGTEKGKPAEILFWTGFLAPWCWLIGGWMLAHSGQTIIERMPNNNNNSNATTSDNSDGRSATELHRQLREQRSCELAGLSTPIGRALSEKGSKSRLAARSVNSDRRKSSSTLWTAAKNSSADLLASIRGDRTQEDRLSTRKLHPIALDPEAAVHHPHVMQPRLDPWVTRCRVAAIVSGMFILALCIVALVVLVRSL